jgi:hypothetical protein
MHEVESTVHLERRTIHIVVRERRNYYRVITKVQLHQMTSLKRNSNRTTANEQSTAAHCLVGRVLHGYGYGSSIAIPAPLPVSSCRVLIKMQRHASTYCIVRFMLHPIEQSVLRAARI